MKMQSIKQSRRDNLLHTLFLLLAMIGLVSIIGWIIGGLFGVICTLLVSVLVCTGTPYYSLTPIFKILRAKPLHRSLNSNIFQMVHTISKRAGLSHTPDIYWVPSRVMNAFVIGREDHAAIVFTDSLLNRLTPRELSNIIGHEIAHIHNRDLWLMNIADTASRLTSFFSSVGQIFIVLSIPFILTGAIEIALIPLLMLISAPTAAFLLQMALSRTREFEADRIGVKLTGDPSGLISALYKLEKYHCNVLRGFLTAPWGITQPSLLRSHPPTQERIERLSKLPPVKPEVPTIRLYDPLHSYSYVHRM